MQSFHRDPGFADAFIDNPATGCQPPCDCNAGKIQTRGCCDCGTQTRTCGGDCRWGGWSECSGSDPEGGGQACDTGRPGPCADGRMKCAGGCLQCAAVNEPSAEVCDGTDNDCNDSVNDGPPSEMGIAIPAYAASLADSSAPEVLRPGERGTVLADFKNAGTETWKAGEIWLAALKPYGGEASRLFAEGDWPAWDVAAVIEVEVPAGGSARLSFKVQASEAPGGTVEEGFQLMAPDGSLMQCPSPAITVKVRVAGGDGGGAAGKDGGGRVAEAGTDAGKIDGSAADAGEKEEGDGGVGLLLRGNGGCGCAASLPADATAGGSWCLVLLFTVGLIAIRRFSHRVSNDRL